MATSWIYLLLISLALTILVLSSRRAPLVVRVFLIAQALYWLIAYVVRPAILLSVRPQPRSGDAIADPRLALDSYTANMTAVLQIVAAGVGFYAVAVAFYCHLLAGRPQRTLAWDLPHLRKHIVATMVACLAMGWTGRVLLEIAPDNRFFELLTLLATVGVIGLIVASRFQRATMAALCLGLLLLGELWWSAATLSKTPIFGALLALGLRVCCTISGRRRVGVLLGIGGIGSALFGAVQALKLSPNVAIDLENAASSYPAGLQPLLAIVRRFDLFSAVTDAYYAGPSSWQSGLGFFNTLVQAVTPGALQSGDKTALGEAWAAQVRAVSLPGSNTQVSLAFGPIAEGWVSGGWVGIAGQSIALVLVLHLTYRLITSPHPAAFALGALLIGYPVLFERGILGNAALISYDLQAVLVVFVIAVFTRSIGIQPQPAHRMGTSGIARL